MDIFDDKIPREEIMQRDGGGIKLDYLSGYYVIARLNEVLKQGNWQYKVLRRDLVFEGKVERARGDTYSVSYLADVELSAIVNGASVIFVDTGYGDGTDNKNPGKAHELAAKEAVTYGLKRCAKNLGMSFGLALYDKEQKNVDDEIVESPKAQVTAKVNQVSPQPNNAANGDVAAIKETLRQAILVLKQKNTISVADLKEKYKFDKIENLNAAATLDLYAKIKHDYPELNLR